MDGYVTEKRGTEGKESHTTMWDYIRHMPRVVFIGRKSPSGRKMKV